MLETDKLFAGSNRHGHGEVVAKIQTHVIAAMA